MEYGFYDRLTEAFPSQVLVDLCQVCNYECIHCPQSQYKYSKACSGAFFSEELNQKLVDEVAREGHGLTQHIRYSAAGEPMLHPQIMPILSYAVKNSKTMVSLTTNGSLVTEEKADQFLNMGLGLIDFSLDAYKDETYAEIRRKGNLSIVRKNVLYMLNKKRKENYKTKIIVSFVLQEKNEAEQGEFKAYWESQGADFVVIRNKHSAGGFFYQNTLIDKWTQPCVYPWERIVIGADGTIDFCPASWQGNTSIGSNFSSKSIKEVWQNKQYRDLRKEHLNNKFNIYTVCEKCPDRELTIWPQDKLKKARGYGEMIRDFQVDVDAKPRD